MTTLKSYSGLRQLASRLLICTRYRVRIFEADGTLRREIILRNQRQADAAFRMTIFRLARKNIAPKVAGAWISQRIQCNTPNGVILIEPIWVRRFAWPSWAAQRKLAAFGLGIIAGLVLTAIGGLAFAVGVFLTVKLSGL